MNRSSAVFRRIVAALTLLVCTAAAIPAARGQTRWAVEAASGEPFGVGHVVMAAPASELPAPLGLDAVRLSEEKGRVLFPAVAGAPVLGAVRDLLDSTPLLEGGPIRGEIGGMLRELLDQPPRAHLFFLFRGTEPFELRIDARQRHAIRVVPRPDRRARDRLLAQWWDAYGDRRRLLPSSSEEPTIVENFLRSSLARRLNLRLPPRQQTAAPKELLARELGMLFEADAVRMAMEQNRLLMLHELGQPADQPLPEPPRVGPLELPDEPNDASVEPIALRVPEECFYVRFGQFDNYLWARDMLGRFGGDLRALAGRQGVDYALADRIERQLVLKTGELAKLLGPAVVADIALIGTDTFFFEGATLGVLVEARSGAAVSAEILRQRLARRLAGGVEERSLRIAGHDVALIESPDGRVRSFHVVDGNYHFVTNSRALAERFLAAARGERSLGRSPAFRHARRLMPPRPEDTLWVYLSDEFFRHLASPGYRTEMIRRLQAAADIELVELARLAAAAEGKPNDSIAALVEAAWLPPDFGPRPDGSETILDGGVVRDRLRGRRGAFVPALDVPVARMTPAEVSEYRRFAEFYQRQWGRTDPTIVAVRRRPLEQGREQLSIALRLSPLAAEHFQWLSRWAGPPSHERLAPIDGDLARLELAMPGAYVFAGLRDAVPPMELAATRVPPLGRLRDVLVGYVGTTGDPGILGLLEGSWAAPALGPGAAPIFAPLARRAGGMSVFSLHADVLDTIVPQLKMVQAERPAQLRLRVADLSGTKIAPWLNQWCYRRARETTLANLRLIESLGSQLRVAPAEAQGAAERLLDARLECPLGGAYALGKSDPAWWTSSALEKETVVLPLVGPTAPGGFVAPVFGPFRGAEVEAVMRRELLEAQVELWLEVPPAR